jgi:hypothetical protein
MSAGIDYGLGRTNIDNETGIRFGVISQGSVGQAWYDEAEADYGPATCPSCGNECREYDESKHDDELGQYDDERRASCCDYVCDNCSHTLDSSDCYGEEPIGWNYSGDGYVLTDCLDSDIMVLKSPFYTRGNYCSPCVPGAVSLESDNEEGAKAYCLGHDWFEESRAPYRVYRVSDDSEVLPD